MLKGGDDAASVPGPAGRAQDRSPYEGETEMPKSSAARQRADKAMRVAAGRALDQVVRAGADLYERERDLPRLAHLTSMEAAADRPDAVEAVVRRLERALRAERMRARSGHWTYDLNRHIALRQAYRAETERLALLRGAKAPLAPRP
jgi:hypothetical protein